MTSKEIHLLVLETFVLIPFQQAAIECVANGHCWLIIDVYFLPAAYGQLQCIPDTQMYGHI